MEQAGVEGQFEEREKSFRDRKSHQIDLERSVTEKTQQFLWDGENDDPG